MDAFRHYMISHSILSSSIILYYIKLCYAGPAQERLTLLQRVLLTKVQQVKTLLWQKRGRPRPVSLFAGPVQLDTLSDLNLEA